MKTMVFRSLLLMLPVILLAFSALISSVSQAADISLKVKPEVSTADSGRLFVIFNRSNEEEPRFYSETPHSLDEAIFAIDLDALVKAKTIKFKNSLGHPYASPSDLPPGLWYAQALYDQNTIAADINAEGNIYGDVQTIEVPESGKIRLSLNLNSLIPSEKLPENTTNLRYFKYRSEVLSNFWNTDIFLRAAVLTPPGFDDLVNKDIPIIFDVGGYRARYTRVSSLMEESGFDEFWNNPETPQMAIVFLDGESPFGDSYQIDSANNGPYGQATWYEFLPYLQEQLGIKSQPDKRFITGCSTGGWVSLAVQIYYPKLFNGAWSFSADGVDFRHFQLVDIYNDKNAFFNEFGNDRPSKRSRDGEIEFTMRQEISMESALGRGNSFVSSSGQWGGWNAVYSPKGEDDLPIPIWNSGTGDINTNVAPAWQKYDLRHYLAENWQDIGKDLSGKLHIWMGDMDNYYLNNAMHIFEDEMKKLDNPPVNADFDWVRRADHCDYKDVPMLKKIMFEMNQRAQVQ